jgi:hypothetical protein
VGKTTFPILIYDDLLEREKNYIFSQQRNFVRPCTKIKQAPWSRVLDKLIIAQLGKNPDFYGI